MSHIILPIIGNIRIVAGGVDVPLNIPTLSALKIPFEALQACSRVDLRDSSYCRDEVQERLLLAEKLKSIKKLSQKDRHKISYYLTGEHSEPERSRGGQSRYEDDCMLAKDFEARVAELARNKSIPEKTAKKQAIDRYCKTEAKIRGAKDGELDTSTVEKAIKRGKKPNPNEPPF